MSDFLKIHPSKNERNPNYQLTHKHPTRITERLPLRPFEPAQKTKHETNYQTINDCTETRRKTHHLFPLLSSHHIVPTAGKRHLASPKDTRLEKEQERKGASGFTSSSQFSLFPLCCFPITFFLYQELYTSSHCPLLLSSRMYAFFQRGHCTNL